MASAPRPGPIILLVALLIATRVLGLSALMPVFTPYGQSLSDSDLLVGIAFGGYGLTMALMQIPMGSLSDRFGRKPLILVGLALYVLGNLVAWRATSIEVLIAARLVEGVGAISSVAMALLTDVIPEARRTFSIAIAGIGAGVAFLLGVSLGGLLELAIGVRGLFLASALLGLVMFVAVAVVVPHVKPKRPDADAPGLLRTLTDGRGLGLAFAGFTMNATLTATMFALPVILVQANAGADAPLTALQYRWLLFGTVLIGGVLSVGAARAADKRGVVPGYSVLAAVMIGVGSAALVMGGDLVWLWILGVVYFGGHSAQSASLPSLVGKWFEGSRRGAAMGGLNTSTYLGSFVGATGGSLLYDRPPLLPVALLVAGGLAALALVAARLRARAAEAGPSGAQTA